MTGTRSGEKLGYLKVGKQQVREYGTAPGKKCRLTEIIIDIFIKKCNTVVNTFMLIVFLFLKFFFFAQVNSIFMA